ncbi:ABC transporter permease [Shimia sp.]|uniref:ABC transporter permease n=1 Tax=Shimia sp. TaxID=1954381 RepID=UPI003298B76D
MLNLCKKSLLNRRFVAGLTILSIALSVALILGVERLRTEARAGFANSVSGVDLIVAARGNDVQILMATVFGVGSTGTGIRWESLEMLEDMPEIEWTVPLMMGDTHRGYPVIGTSAAYFERFRHSGGQTLSFEKGSVSGSPEDAVVGADVAQAFGYEPGTEIVNAHGAGQVSFYVHDESPFIVRGVLAPTGTAVDRMVFVPLEGFDALHENAAQKVTDPFSRAETSGDREERAEPDRHAGHGHHGHAPDTINAIYAGLKSKPSVLSVQRKLANYREDALTAVLPNVALLQLWSITGTAETALRLMSGAVALAGVIGMVVMLSAALDARRREFAILRSVGATPGNIFVLIISEAVMLLLAGILLGYIVLSVVTVAVDPILAAKFGLRIGLGLPTLREALLIAMIFCSGLIAGAVPAFRVYRMTLADGLSMRL